MQRMKIYGWGYNEDCQLGLNQSQENEDLQNISFNMISNLNFEVQSIKSGESHTLILTEKGELMGMGNNSSGQLGFNKNIDSVPLPSLIYFPHKISIQFVSCGSEHSFGYSSNHCLYGWGLNLKGQLGLGDQENRMEPEKVELINILQPNEYIVDIQCGALHTAFVTNFNRGFSCGYNNRYALCQQDNIDSNVFLEIQQLKQIQSQSQIQIRCGISLTGFLIDNKIFICGQLTYQSTNIAKQIIFKSFQQIDNNLCFVDLMIGNYFVVGLNYQGDVYSMGDNMYGQLGIGQNLTQLDRFQKVEGVREVQSIYCGSNHCLAIGVDKIWGWGNNEQNQVNQQQNLQYSQPIELDFVKPQDIHYITCGDFHVICSTFKSLNINRKDNNKKQLESEQQLIFKCSQMQQELEMLKVELNQEKVKNKYSEQKIKELQQHKQSFDKQTQTQDGQNQINKKKKGNLPEPRQFNISLEIPYSELKFEKQIGEGGYGKIYLGRWRELTVAIKMLKPQCLNDIVIRDFLSECRAMEILRHPNICMFLGACTQPPNFALVLEYCSRGSLMSLIQNREINLNWDDKKRLALETCRALNYLHSFSPPILHRDLKSLNLLIDEFFRIKLADFGWTKILDNYMTGKIGTYQWMAPEVISMYQYTEKADVYSFGIILWEISAREPPFRNISGSNVAKEVIANDLRPTIPEKVPKNLTKLIKKCWDRDPAKRPSFNEIIKELESFKF